MEVNRRIKPHRKSRRGCGNCKLRKVKCDENKPECKRCAAFGVLCNYENRNSDVQLLFNKAMTSENLHHRLPYSLNQTITTSNYNGLWTNQNLYDLGEQEHLEILNRFRSRTIFSITTKRNLQIYQDEMIKLACLNPHLMHALLTLTLMHDRHLSPAQNIKMSSAELFHWSQSIISFSKKLSSSPKEVSERDALLATSILLGTIAFCHIEAETPEQAWPLKPPSSLDLNWLIMSYGKKEVWKLGLDENASAFQKLMAPTTISSTITPSSRFFTLPPVFVSMYGLDANSTINNNPYHFVASTLADVLDIDDAITVIMKFWSFVSGLHPQFKTLLLEKEPKAILLLAYWLAKVCQFPHWWIWRRVSLECQAICIYLDRYHRDDFDLYELLRFPKMMSGLVAR